MREPTHHPLSQSVLRALARIRGVVAAAAVPPETAAAIRAAEERSEGIAGVRNLGMVAALARTFVLAVLKDESFRRPPAPTLYLVEEGDAPPEEVLRVEGRSYHVVGEERPPGHTTPQGSIRLGEAFCLYTERRRDPTRAVQFLLPPVPFPELEREPWASRLREVVSASPSSGADTVIRVRLGLAQDSRLATLVLGFDPVATT